ncbi:MAG: hypothetical protein HY821_11720 [Acidobacteria bacterium]|nr:hypothetical protein [Acidobacteriota bacterium]
MNYSSARTLASLAGAGTLAVLAAIAFLYQLPSTFFPYSGGPLGLDLFALLLFYLAYAAISFPFDVWAGYSVPCRYLGECDLFPLYLGRLVRGIAAQGLVMIASAAAILVGGRLWGTAGAASAFVLALCATALARPYLHRYLSTRPAPPATPRAWSLAIAWNLAGFALSVSLPWCGVATTYSLLETLLGCSLWSLLGLAILPRIDRQAASLALYLSWASFGLLSRATAEPAGRPERWA